MKGFPESDTDSIDNCSTKNSGCSNSPTKSPGSVSDEAEPGIGCRKHQILSGIWPPALSIFGHSSGSSKRSECKSCSTNSSSSSSPRKKLASGKNYYEGWRAVVRRVMMNGGSMRRILGFSRTVISNSTSDIWLLGVCYHVAQEGDDSSNPTQSEGFAAFVDDFSSRILITYRKGFSPIGDSKYSSDVNWGCMLRSSQMLVAQAFLVHKLGRSWRKSPDKPLDETYLKILHLFGDAEDSPFSIHNLLQEGSAYGLAAGSWVGPYAMCRTWESLMRNKKESDGGALSSIMALYVVSGDEDGERGGAPVLCIEDISRYCSEFHQAQVDWAPVLLMVPLVLGLEKVNPRYLPLLCATFQFPQSLGILGGRPGASTYIIGVQDDKAFYLDPHEVQQVVNLKKDDVDADTSSYHCNVLRHIALDSLDSSLAFGFYCRDKSDFDDFCVRATNLVDQSKGAPLFTIAETRRTPRPGNNATEVQDCDLGHGLPTGESENSGQEDDWELL
ncbi:cysteine protease ATG4b-like [Salvia splendens]|uniref:cysteine protease ATG4b-like n=1 Tax=Salvia splendens TaxID=180675 RepID=UPI001C27C2E7|nr:cysteine protease ATG4b-like [Salvia splendens]XP_042017818.1 cysteine protease ATG4b-like [Salvia splendens]